MGVLEAHMETLNLAASQQRQASAITNHGVPTGIIKSANPDLTDGEALQLKATWMANQATRTVQVINADTDFEPLSWNPEQLQLVEARKFTLGELELIFGLPVGWLGGMTNARQYSNIEQDAINLLRFALGGHLARFEQTLSLAFPRGTEVRANLDAILRSDTKTRYEAHRIALGSDAPFLSVDEVREIEHRAPLPDKPMEPDLFAGDGEGGDPMPMVGKPAKAVVSAGGGGK
jgi:HK97 family phage portal protein